MNEEQNQIIIYNTDDGKVKLDLLCADDSAFLNQKQLSQLFDTSVQNIGQHISNILNEGELSENSVVKYFFTTANDGKEYKTAFYSLDMILAIGFRVRSKRGVQFRIWANTKLKEYLQKGFIIDNERLKNPNGRYDYFDELLERIRDIRASEKRFYQKVRDLFSLSSDYDSTDKATQMFFAQTQNKFLYAITKQTASELILNRAKSDEPNMGLTSWKGKIVRKQDIIIAKNYLSEDEIDELNRFVVVFLETAELRAKNRQDITMDFWRENVDKILDLNDKEVLKDTGNITHDKMKKVVFKIYEEFDKNRKVLDAKLADLADLKALEDDIKLRVKE